jgi:CubicO group peptidase (beta-lactamase class C family)
MKLLLQIVSLFFLFLNFNIQAQTFIFSSPESVGFSTKFFTKFKKEIQTEVPSLASFIVYKNDVLIFEEYFNNTDKNTLFQVKSVTKSVVSALVGIANDKKLLPNLNTPVELIFPEYARDLTINPTIWYRDFLLKNDSLRAFLTIEDLLMMQAGFLWDDNNPIVHRAFQNSSDPVRYIFELPFETKPGTSFKYNTGASHLLGAVISKSVNCDLKQFADSFLFKPLEIQSTIWTSDPMGRTSGGAELSLTARNMLQFGCLFLNQGTFNGKQIISKEWIENATKEQVVLDEWDVLPNANGYGYYWWRRKSCSHQVFVASGYGGQLICIIPDLKMVITTTCLINEKNRGRSEIKRLHLLIDRVVKESLKN